MTYMSGSTTTCMWNIWLRVTMCTTERRGPPPRAIIHGAPSAARTTHYVVSARARVSATFAEVVRFAYITVSSAHSQPDMHATTKRYAFNWSCCRGPLSPADIRKKLQKKWEKLQLQTLTLDYFYRVWPSHWFAWPKHHIYEVRLVLESKPVARCQTQNCGLCLGKSERCWLRKTILWSQFCFRGCGMRLQTQEGTVGSIMSARCVRLDSASTPSRWTRWNLGPFAVSRDQFDLKHCRYTRIVRYFLNTFQCCTISIILISCPYLPTLFLKPSIVHTLHCWHFQTFFSVMFPLWPRVSCLVWISFSH